ncbi:MAG TPA: IPT/TIG domain-containing protein, partial [Bryobacteraceae bacterium]|nr:IPT/TIG domain-containing protein [Bryobacteraceae bacterium]
ITVDAGPLAGSKVLPVTFTVTSGTGSGAPVIGAVVNAASFQPVPLVAGSLATILGSNLGGMSVAVTFNAIPAKLLYTGASQINLQVPAELALKTTAQMIVTVDGQSAAQTVALAQVSPAIFNAGVLNQDNTLNSASQPADLGSVIQIFATGLLSPGSGTISASIAGRAIPTPSYAGPAPGIAGLQQVNLIVPADLPPGATLLQVCAVAADPNQPVCSPQATVYLK